MALNVQEGFRHAHSVAEGGVKTCGGAEERREHLWTDQPRAFNCTFWAVSHARGQEGSTALNRQSTLSLQCELTYGSHWRHKYQKLIKFLFNNSVHTLQKTHFFRITCTNLLIYV